MEMRAVLEGAGVTAAFSQNEPECGAVVPATVHGRDMVFAVSGVGPINAGIMGGKLAALGVGGIVSLGIAGTYAPAVAPLGSVVVATEEVLPEYGLAGEHGVDARALGFPQYGDKRSATPPPVWESLFLEPEKSFAAMNLPYLPCDVSREAENPLVTAGVSVTVAGVSGTENRARFLAARYAALTENMEGFSLALAARHAGIPFGEIRSVSNIVGARSGSAWNIPAALAALSRVTRLLCTLRG